MSTPSSVTLGLLLAEKDDNGLAKTLPVPSVSTSLEVVASI